MYLFRELFASMHTRRSAEAFGEMFCRGRQSW